MCVYTHTHIYIYTITCICILLVCYTHKCYSVRVAGSREQLAFPVFLFSRFQVMEETSTSSGPADEESETFIRVRN